MSTHGCFQDHFSHANTCTGQISFLWSKFKIGTQGFSSVEMTSTMGHHLLRQCRTLWTECSIHCHTWISQASQYTWIVVKLQRKILNLWAEFHTRDQCWDVNQHICKNASTARREPIALVHPRSRIHTVGGAEFSVWKANLFSHASSGCLIWNEKALGCSSDSSVSTGPSGWDGISASTEYPYENNAVPFANGFHEASPSCKPTCLGTGAGRRCTPCRSASRSPTNTGNLLSSLLLNCAVASQWFCPPRRVRRCTSCSA